MKMTLFLVGLQEINQIVMENNSGINSINESFRRDKIFELF